MRQAVILWIRPIFTGCLFSWDYIIFDGASQSVNKNKKKALNLLHDAMFAVRKKAQSNGIGSRISALTNSIFLD